MSDGELALLEEACLLRDAGTATDDTPEQRVALEHLGDVYTGNLA
jgi:hypothetical protein